MNQTLAERVRERFRRLGVTIAWLCWGATGLLIILGVWDWISKAYCEKPLMPCDSDYIAYGGTVVLGGIIAGFAAYYGFRVLGWIIAGFLQE